MSNNDSNINSINYFADFWYYLIGVIIITINIRNYNLRKPPYH